MLQLYVRVCGIIERRRRDASERKNFYFFLFSKKLARIISILVIYFSHASTRELLASRAFIFLLKKREKIFCIYMSAASATTDVQIKS